MHSSGVGFRSRAQRKDRELSLGRANVDDLLLITLLLAMAGLILWIELRRAYQRARRRDREELRRRLAVFEEPDEQQR
jgi:hypothetical protein